MTDEQIFEVAEMHGWLDDFGRWNFQGDKLLNFVEEIIKAQRDTDAGLIESVPTILYSSKFPPAEVK